MLTPEMLQKVFSSSEENVLKDLEEVRTELLAAKQTPVEGAVEGKQKLVKSLKSRQMAEHLVANNPELGKNVDELEEELNTVALTLKAKRTWGEWLSGVKDSIVKGGKWALDKVGQAFSAVKNNPGTSIAVVLIALAVIAGLIATGAYMAGSLELLMSQLGIGHLYGTLGLGQATETLGKVFYGASEMPVEVAGGGATDIINNAGF